MNGLVAAALQFYANRRLAGAGNALNEIISFLITHFPQSRNA